MTKVQKLLSKDLKNLNIKPLPDEELHRLLLIATRSEDEDEKKKARKKIVLHILPIIINRCKKYFPEDYLIENTDFINEVVMLIMDRAFENFRMEEQEEGRCSLFFKAIQYYFLLAYKNLKRKQFGTHEVNFKEFLNPKADKDFYQNLNFLKENLESYNDKDFSTSELSWSGSEDWLEEWQEEDYEALKRASYQSELTEAEKEIEKKEYLQLLNKEVFARCSLLDNILINSTGLTFLPYAFSSKEIANLWDISRKKINSLKKYTIKKVKNITQFYLGKLFMEGVTNGTNTNCSI